MCSEKLKVLSSICSIVCMIAFISVCILGWISESATEFLITQCILSAIGLMAISIEFGARFISNEDYGTSICIMLICLTEIILSVTSII